MINKFKYIFGPVPSRRLGNSLGIDLLVKKICTFDCTYCEVGRTVLKTNNREEYVPFDEVINELKEYLVSNFNTIDFITFSGSGEPTLFSRLGEMITEIKKFTSIPIAVITNSSTITDKDVFNELLKADLVMPSIDSLIPAKIKLINRPMSKFDMNDVVEALSSFKKVYSGKLWLEILICKDVNDSRDDFLKFKNIVTQINPDVTLINTVARPSMSGNVHPVTDEKILELKKIIGATAKGIKPYLRKSKDEINNVDNIHLKEALVYSLLKIRSCHFEEICSSVSLTKENLKKIIKNLENKSKINVFSFNGLDYYKILAGSNED